MSKKDAIKDLKMVLKSGGMNKLENLKMQIIQLNVNKTGWVWKKGTYHLYIDMTISY